VPSPNGLGIPNARRARKGSRRGGKRNPTPQPERNSLRPLEVRRRRGAATPGSTLALAGSSRLAPPRGEMWLIFSPQTHLLDGRHGVTTADDRAAARAASAREGVGHHRWCRRRNLSNLEQRPSARSRSRFFAVGQGLPGRPGVNPGRCRGPSSRRGSRSTAVVRRVGVGGEGVGEHDISCGSSSCSALGLALASELLAKSSLSGSTRLLPTAKGRAPCRR